MGTVSSVFGCVAAECVYRMVMQVMRVITGWCLCLSRVTSVTRLLVYLGSTLPEWLLSSMSQCTTSMYVSARIGCTNTMPCGAAL